MRYPDSHNGWADEGGPVRWREDHAARIGAYTAVWRVITS